MKPLSPKWLATLAAVCSTLAVSARAEVFLPTPAEQIGFTPRIQMQVVGNYPISWVSTALTNVPAGYSVTSGAYIGWCVNSLVPIDPPPATYEPILYNSYEDLSAIGAADPDWDVINYIINKRADYVTTLGATASELQSAIYKFVGGGGYGESGLDSGAFAGLGFPAPNMGTVNAIVADATVNGEGFIPDPGQLTAIVLDLGPTIQRTIIEVKTPSGRLGDFVWRDNNHNGIQDAGEPGIEGVTVWLKDSTGTTILDTMVTDADGLYLFEGLLAGNYIVEVDSASPALLGLLPTITGAGTTVNDSNSNPTPASLPTDESEDLTYDFGYYAPMAPTGKIGNFVWKDLNANGRQDAGEPGINGVKLTLKDGIGTILATQVTSGNGAYLFTGLTAGNYSVELDESSAALIGLFPTTVNAAGTTTANDSNPTPAITNLPTDSSEDLTLDFGFISPGCGCIGNRVWKDYDCDGIQDCNEPGIKGVTVVLKKGTTVLKTTVTNDCGYYWFTGLQAGTYTVSIVNTQAALTGLVPTKLAGTTNKYYDSNPNPATVVLATSKSCDFSIDFGYKKAPLTKHCTWTMDGWGCNPCYGKGGKWLCDNWTTVYPNGCVIGGTKWIKFTRPSGIECFLPCGGTSCKLNYCYTNPTSGCGSLAGHLLALKLNCDFSDCGISKPGLKNCKFKYGKFAGKTVGYVLDLAHKCLGGQTLPYGCSYYDLAEACKTVNENYNGGTDCGKLTQY